MTTNASVPEPPDGPPGDPAGVQRQVQDTLWRLRGNFHKTVDLAFERIHRMLAELGEPHRQLPPVVHVSGTNGKGSTLAFLRAMLEAAGYRVHVYTSPHLVRFNERIVLAGQQIGDRALLDVLQEVERINAGQQLTYFEATTSAAFLAFSRTPADILLLETGLGGRLDATNVVEQPLLTAMTKVSRDHTAQLGDTIEEIAGEKAGMLKAGVPLVLAAQEPRAERVVERRAQDLEVPVWRLGDAYTGFVVDPKEDGFRYRSGEYDLVLPRPALPGDHQVYNAGTAIALARALGERGFKIREKALYRGLAEVRWPGRLQDLDAPSLAGRLPAGSRLWLDGGHNDSAGGALAQHLAQQTDDRPLYLITGRLDTKEPGEFLRHLVPYAAGVRAVPIKGEPEAINAQAGADEARWLGFPDVEACPDIAHALDSVAEATGGGAARVLICGSLYLAGYVLAVAEADTQAA